MKEKGMLPDRVLTGDERVHALWFHLLSFKREVTAWHAQESKERRDAAVTALAMVIGRLNQLFDLDLEPDAAEIRRSIEELQRARDTPALQTARFTVTTNEIRSTFARACSTTDDAPRRLEVALHSVPRWLGHARLKACGDSRTKSYLWDPVAFAEAAHKHWNIDRRKLKAVLDKHWTARADEFHEQDWFPETTSTGNQRSNRRKD